MYMHASFIVMRGENSEEDVFQGHDTILHWKWHATCRNSRDKEDAWDQPVHNFKSSYTR